MPPKKLLISGPGQGVAAASPVEPLLPDPSDALGEFQETTEIRRTAVVLVMPPEFAIERFLRRVHQSIEDSSEVPQVWRLDSEGSWTSHNGSSVNLRVATGRARGL